MASGLLTKLSSTDQSVKELLDNTIIKIIPMINPDGVVFGNFRTNFIGIDMNRAFNSTDEVINPEILALK